MHDETSHLATCSSYIQGLNSISVTSAFSIMSELSRRARCSQYLPLYWYTSKSPQGVGLISVVRSNHLGLNLCPFSSLLLFSARCLSSRLERLQKALRFNLNISMGKLSFQKVKEWNLLFSNPALDRSPFSRASLSGRKRESDANSPLGVVSKLFTLCPK